MKTIIMAVTINYMLRLGLKTEVEELLKKGRLKTTSQGIEYILIEKSNYEK